MQVDFDPSGVQGLCLGIGERLTEPDAVIYVVVASFPPELSSSSAAGVIGRCPRRRPPIDEASAAAAAAGWDDDTYRHVDVVAANKVFVSVNETAINTETRSVPVAGGRGGSGGGGGGGVYFAFRDQGACTTLIAVRVYYIICPSTVANLAVFPDTSTGPEMTAVVQRTGVCVENAVVEQVPSYLCKGDGSWYFPTGHCRCAAGHEPREQQRCVGE